MATVLDAFKDARSLLNDEPINGVFWTNAILLRFVPKAHRDMQLALVNNGLPVIKEVSAILQVAALAQVFTTPPTDIVLPIYLEERGSGSSDKYDEMTELDWENQNFDQISSLIYWTWREDEVKFVGATTNREVRMRYKKGLTIPSAVGTSIGVIYGEAYLGPKIAALAAASLGNDTLAAEANDDAEKEIETIVNINVKGGQSRPIQRIPYHRRRRSTLAI